MNKVKRICDGCGKDCHQLFQVNSGSGHSVGLFGTCCAGWVRSEQNLISYRHGQIIMTVEEVKEAERVIREQKPKNPPANPSIRCNNCGREFFNEEELTLFHDGQEFFKGCPKCETDGYLIDLPTEKE